MIRLAVRVFVSIATLVVTTSCESLDAWRTDEGEVYRGVVVGNDEATCPSGSWAPASSRVVRSRPHDAGTRRRPEETLLHALVREHWPRFLERAEEEGGLPRFVVREFEEYLRCGLLEHGGAACVPLVRPRDAGGVLVQAAGLCPRAWVGECRTSQRTWSTRCFRRSRRRWVCSQVAVVVGATRWPTTAGCARTLGAFIRAARCAARSGTWAYAVDEAQVGAVTFIQRSDSALR
ncbi:MAG: hypothetical protein KF901_23555 [Myxococcales bacterium]|nr:hypothetical protein [Myxococcales bacterium]